MNYEKRNRFQGERDPGSSRLAVIINFDVPGVTMAIQIFTMFSIASFGSWAFQESRGIPQMLLSC